MHLFSFSSSFTYLDEEVKTEQGVKSGDMYMYNLG